MARKSRRTMQVQAEAVKTQKIAFYKAALYARLSMETEINRERDTAGTQLELMRAFVSEQDDIEIAEEYCDRSVSGTTFERPDFERMITDIKLGKVNCVIVKDLSRLGRDHIETGNFIERVFPFLGVRFIAVTDHFDSDRKDMDLTIPLKNIINECYARDISRKVLTGKDNAWKQGKFIAGNCTYGYQKNPENIYQLIVDAEAATAVRRIFQMFLDGMNYADIAKVLHEEKVPTPDEHKAYQRGNHAIVFKYEWTGRAIKEILRNRVYLGHIVHGRTRTEFYRGMKTTRIPREQWQVIENTHEAIISQEIFDKAQILVDKVEKQWLEVQGKKIGIVSSKNFYHDKIVCVDCNARMHLRKQKQRYAFVCMTYYTKGKSVCVSHRAYLEDVDAAVLAVIKQHMKVCIDTETAIRELNARNQSRKQYNLLLSEISKLQKKIEQISEKKMSLYNDYAERLINEEEYLAYSENYTSDLNYLKEKVDQLLFMQTQYSTEYRIDADWKSVIETYMGKRRLSQEMVNAFVDKIRVDADGNCEVHLKYDDLLLKLLDLETERRAIL